MGKAHLYRVAITAIIEKEGKYLIVRRSQHEDRWPGKWVVPGGQLDPSDYARLPKSRSQQWYNVLEQTLRREVKDEVGLDIDNIVYVTSIVADDAPPILIISMYARYAGGELKLQQEEIEDAAWVTSEEARAYDLIDGVHDELCVADNIRKKAHHVLKEDVHM